MFNKSMLIVVVGWSHAACFAAYFEIKNNDIRTTISNRDFNRISIENDQINQAFFKASDFLIKLDEPNGQLFFIPRNNTSEYPLSLTVTSAKKTTQHFFFTPKNIGSKTIILKKPIKPLVVQKEGVGEDVKKLMEQLINGRVAASQAAKSIAVKRGWKLKRVRVVSHPLGIKGYVLTLKNISKTKQNVTADMLWKDCTLAISISKHSLARNEEAKIFMVTTNRGAL